MHRVVYDPSSDTIACECSRELHLIATVLTLVRDAGVPRRCLLCRRPRDEAALTRPPPVERLNGDRMVVNVIGIFRDMPTPTN